MASKARAFGMRVRLAVRQNRVAVGFVLVWLVSNSLVFSRMFGMSRAEALATATCISKAHGGFPGVYQSFTEIVVFGLVASMVATNVTRRYRPEETSRALAAEAEGHVVVVGLTNLGRRTLDLVTRAGHEVVVVEEDPSLVRDLVRDERPVVVGSARDPDVLDAANVAKAKVVVVATDDLETGAIACRHMRERNPSCELVLRCSDDDVGQVLGKTYRARIVSTSKLAAELVASHAREIRAREVTVLGSCRVATRIGEALAHARIAHTLAEVSADPVALREAGVGKSDLVVLCDDDLGKNLVRLDRIRDLAPRVKIVCRAFHDDAGDILERAPFSCTVISTSRHALEVLVRQGTFRELGIVAAPPLRGRPVIAVA